MKTWTCCSMLADPELSMEERRAILSWWASDACAEESAPALRRPPFAPAPVTFDEVMYALLKLDHPTDAASYQAEGQLRDRPAASV